MLSKEDNELLTRVGKGTPMGELLRRYWHPVLTSSELPEPEGRPVRVRLLGEDLVAFRDSAGRVGLLGANCCHRGAPLFFGRNEDGGLRCMYHGWKYDVTGQCLDMPNVPAESDFKEKVRQPSYPTEERNAVIWTYMGPAEHRPQVPDLDPFTVPPDHVHVGKHVNDCNWAQSLEGDFDPSHINFLHAPAPGTIKAAEGQAPKRDAYAQAGETSEAGRREEWFRSKDRQPLITVVPTEHGVLVGARREGENDQFYWRVNQLVLPYYAFVPTVLGLPLHCNIWQPMDDEHTMVWRISYRFEAPLKEEELGRIRSGFGSAAGADDYLPATTAAGGRWRTKQSRENDYLVDWERQRTAMYSGVRGIWAQDKMATEGMSSIMDRSREHMGPSDIGVIQMRRMYLSAAKALRDHGTPPPGLLARLEAIRVPITYLPKDLPWDQVAARLLPPGQMRVASGG